MSLYDTLSAEKAFRRSETLNEDYLPAQVRLAAIRIRRGDAATVLSSLAADTAAMKYPQAMIIAAEAHAMSGRAAEARKLLDEVGAAIPPYAVELRLVLGMIRDLSVDSLAARWYFDDSAGAPPPGPVLSHPLSVLMRARRALRVGDSRAACEAMRGWDNADAIHFPPDDSDVFSAQVQLWRAETCGRIDPGDAASAGDRAAELFRRAGEPNLAHYAADRSAFARWKLSRSDGRTTGSSSAQVTDQRDP